MKCSFQWKKELHDTKLIKRGYIDEIAWNLIIEVIYLTIQN